MNYAHLIKEIGRGVKAPHVLLMGHRAKVAL
jgi:hypothetical protein